MHLRMRIIAVFFASLFMFLSSTPHSTYAEENKVTRKEVQREMREAATALRQYAAAQRREALKKAEELLVNLDRRIEQLEQDMDEKWASMSAATRARTRETLTALRQHRNEVAEWYGGLKHSSDGAWEHMKNGFSDAYTDLGEAWHKAREEFDKEE